MMSILSCSARPPVANAALLKAFTAASHQVEAEHVQQVIQR